MDYELIKSKILEVQELLREILQDCKGNSEIATTNRRKYRNVKILVSDLLDIL